MSDEAAVITAPVDQGSSVSRLAAGFEALENVDNLAAEAPIEAAPLPDEPKPDEPKEEPKAEETEEVAEEEPAEEASFDAIDGEQKFLNVDEIREAFPRQRKGLYELTAKYSEGAKKYTEVEARLGGAEFVEPAAELTQALRDGDAFKALEVVGNKFGQDDLLNVVGNAMYMAYEHKKSLTDPKYAGFREGLDKLTNIAFQSEFGENVTPERVRELIAFDAIGAFEKLDKWVTSNEIDPDEWDELVTLKANPQLSNLAKENAELKRQLEAKKSEVKAEPVKEPEIDNFFIKTVPDAMDKVLVGVVWKNSPLRDLPADTPEMKEKKELFREQLKDKAVIAFNRGEASARLKQGVKYGKQETATFKSDFSNAINAAILSTKPETAKYEGILAELYGKTRNAQLTAKPTSEKLAPTEIKQAPPAPAEGTTVSRLDAFFRSQTP